MKSFVRVMKALSDPNRVRIMKLLDSKDLCVCELQALIGLAQSTVSKHLKVLEEANLVEHKKEGLWIIYRLAQASTCPYASVLLLNLKQWLNEDTTLCTMLKRLPEIDKRNICIK